MDQASEEFRTSRLQATTAARAPSAARNWKRFHDRYTARKAGSTALVYGTILLGSCQIQSPSEEITASGAAESPIHFEHRDFAPEQSEFHFSKDPQTGGKFYYANFYGPDGLSEVVLTEAGPGRVYGIALERIERSVSLLIPDDWQILWGGRGDATSGFGYTPYRLFQIPDQSLNCVGFTQTAGAPDDRNQRPRLVTGFFCCNEPRPMTPEYAQELLAQVKLTR